MSRIDRGSASATCALAVGALAGALCAACANVALSTLDHPTAFREFSGLLAPLGVSFLIFAAAGGLLVALAWFPLRRVGWAAPVVALAAATLVTSVAALWPVAAVLARDLSAKQDAALLALVALSATCTAAAVGLVADRASLRPGLRLAGCAPLAAGLLLVGLWWLDLPAQADAARPTLLPPVAAGSGALPCVVLLTVDTLRADFVGGAPGPPTPAIDSLLADSVVFENARSAAPWTKPAVASLLTGLSPLVHRATAVGRGLPEPVTTLAETMQAAGYTTVGIGLNEHLGAAFGFDQGFSEYYFPARGGYGRSLGSLLLSRLWPSRFPAERVSSEGIADVAIDWIRTHSERPFFLWLHILDPHWPYWPPERWAPEGGPAFWGDHDTVTHVQAGILKLAEPEREHVRELYRSEIRYVDETVGSVLRVLKEQGLYDRGLIAFASDHGEEFWEHGRFEHGHSQFDEVLRVPLALKLPGAEPRLRITAPVSTESLTPTLVDLLGGSPGLYTSRSLRGHFDAERSAGEAAGLFANGAYYYGEKSMVIVRERFKVVTDTETGRRDVYDLVADPTERHSLTASRPDLVAEADVLWTRRVSQAERLRRDLGIEESESLLLTPASRGRLRALGYLDEQTSEP